jgi:hypothetical protein
MEASTSTSPSASSSPAELHRRNRERALGHINSELRARIEDVWPTIIKPGDLEWSDSLGWANALVDGAGVPKINALTTPEEVRGYYEHIYSVRPAQGWVMTSLLTGDFWVLVESDVEYFYPATQERGYSTSAAVLMVDGAYGISGEMTWRRYVEPENGQTNIDRHQVLLTRNAASVERDLAALLALYDGGVQAALRAYDGRRPSFVGMDGRDELRAFYAAQFEAVDVLAVSIDSETVKPWYLMAELLWRVQLGPWATAEIRTIETVFFGRDGRVVAHLGSGIAPLPIDV